MERGRRSAGGTMRGRLRRLRGSVRRGVAPSPTLPLPETFCSCRGSPGSRPGWSGRARQARGRAKEHPRGVWGGLCDRGALQPPAPGWWASLLGLKPPQRASGSWEEISPPSPAGSAHSSAGRFGLPLRAPPHFLARKPAGGKASRRESGRPPPSGRIRAATCCCGRQPAEGAWRRGAWREADGGAPSEAKPWPGPDPAGGRGLAERRQAGGVGGWQASRARRGTYQGCAAGQQEEQERQQPSLAAGRRRHGARHLQEEAERGGGGAGRGASGGLGLGRSCPGQPFLCSRCSQRPSARGPRGKEQQETAAVARAGLQLAIVRRGRRLVRGAGEARPREQGR